MYMADFLKAPLTALGVLATAVACGPSWEQPADSPEPREDRVRAEYAVYSSVLDAFAGEGTAREDDISFGADVDHLYRDQGFEAHIVTDSTHGVLIWGLEREDLILTSMEELSGLPDEVVADYAAANEAGRVLSADAFTTRTSVMVLSRAEIRELTGGATRDGRAFRNPLPAPGYVTFSRVGFAEDRGLATLFVDFVCGGRCGAGQILVLEKRDERWHVRQAKTIIRY